MSSDSPRRSQGSSVEVRFPFAGSASAPGRQDTVLSPPRLPDAEPRSGTSATATETGSRISSISGKLFPHEVQDAASQDLAGIQLGHFAIERRIGAGGMGTVFLAIDDRLERQVALKVLSPSQTADPASVQRFQNEARAAARLDHDHVARVFYYGEDKGLHYIAYEYVQGTNLRELIRARGRLEPAEVVGYAIQLATALCHTSASGVVHRDIKPSNIIVTPQGKAKLVDLGLARKESLSDSEALTVAGTTLGTFDYISPEQAKDPRNVDVRSDIYSLGCTLYHALTGEPPFPEGTVLQRLLDHQDKEPPDPSMRNRRVSPALSAVVRKMMAGDLRRRYPRPEDLLHDLLLVGGAMGLRGVHGNAAMASALLPRRGHWWTQNLGWILTAAGLLGAAAAIQLSPNLAQTLSFATPPTTSDAVKPETETPVELPESATTGERLITSSGRIPPLTEAVGGASSSNAIASKVADDPLMGTSRPTLFDGQAPPLLSDTLPLVGIPPLLPTDLGTRATTPSPKRPGGEVGTAGDEGTGRTTRPGESSRGKDPLRSEPPRTVDASRTPDSKMVGESTTVAETVRSSEPQRSEPLINNPPANPEVSLQEPFVISGTGRGYESLEAACAEARDLAVIELNFNGRSPLPERAFRLMNKRITVQAAKGKRPIVWFAPRDAITDPLQSRMISVTGGSLSFVNVGIELQVPETSSADLWALFRLSRSERLRLQTSQVTILNPAHAAATVIEISAPASDAFTKMGAMKDGQPLVPSEVLLQQCVVRGATSAVRLRDSAAYRLEFTQSLFAIGEWLLQAETDSQAMPGSFRLNLELTHTTCLLGQGLLRTSGSDDLSGRVLPIEVAARNNIFSWGPTAPLLEQQVAVESMDSRRALTWVGERNFFDNQTLFWRMQSVTPGNEQRWDFAAWKNYWGGGEISGSQNLAISWLQDWRQREWAKITPDDARLDAANVTNPAVGSVDGADAGAWVDFLPSFSSR